MLNQSFIVAFEDPTTGLDMEAQCETFFGSWSVSFFRYRDGRMLPIGDDDRRLGDYAINPCSPLYDAIESECTNLV